MVRFILFFCCTIFFSSCSFNKLFLAPYKIPADAKYAKLPRKNGDTTKVYFNGEAHQPVFTKNGNDTIQTGYTIESVVFTSKSGNQLNGWFIKPKNGIVENTIIHFHGNAGNLLYQYAAMVPLVNKGFQIFMFDYSGFGFSEGKATRKNVLMDAHSALDYIKTREEVKGTKLVIYGQSLGGHLSAVVAKDRQTEIDALVIEGAFSSHHDVATYFVRRLVLIGSIARVVVRDGYSAKRSIKDYKKPLLVIHSTVDETVPFYMGKRIYKKAKSSTVKEFYQIDKCHICGPIYFTDEIAEKIRKLLQ